MSEAVRKSTQGVLKDVTIRNGWYGFNVMVPGRQHPVKLETKREDIIAQANAIPAGQMATWTFQESEGNPNPNRPGQNYMNRMLESAIIGGPEAAPAAQATQQSFPPNTGPAAQQQAAPAAAVPVTTSSWSGNDDSPEKRRSIERQTIVKSAMPLYPIAAIGDEAAFWTLLYRLDAFITGKSDATPAAAIPATTPPAQQFEEDDIPF